MEHNQRPASQEDAKNPQETAETLVDANKGKSNDRGENNPLLQQLNSEIPEDRPYQPYQYPNQWGELPAHGYPYGFPGQHGFRHGHRPHHHEQRGHRDFRGYRWGHGYHGYHGHHGYSYQGQNQNLQEQILIQYPPFYGYPPHQIFPPPPPPNGQMPPPPFGLSPPHGQMPPPSFGMPPPPPMSFNHPPPPFVCPPPLHFLPAREEDDAKRSCQREKKWHHGKHRGRKHRRDSSSRSRSKSSCSSSSSQESKYQKQNPSLKKAESIRYEEEITNFYKKEMNDFMQSRQINEMQREKIIKILRKKFPAYDAPLFEIRQCLQIVEKEKLVFRMSYVKIIKVLLKCQLDLSEAIPRIQRIQYHKVKKYEADCQFTQNYGESSQTPLIEVNDLILMQTNDQRALYLVDGNNILPTNKHFRRYFQSKRAIEKVFGQIRTRWYISHCFQRKEVILFFDERYEDRDYELANKYTFPNKVEQERANEVEVIYGDGRKADDKIVEKLVELSLSEEKVEIVLVSADRDLNMRCQLIKPILHTSGRYFFKYCKYSINRKYKQDKKMKHLAKGIAAYDQYKY